MAVMFTVPRQRLRLSLIFINLFPLSSSHLANVISPGEQMFQPYNRISFLTSLKQFYYSKIYTWKYKENQSYFFAIDFLTVFDY